MVQDLSASAQLKPPGCLRVPGGIYSSVWPVCAAGRVHAGWHLPVRPVVGFINIRRRH